MNKSIRKGNVAKASASPRRSAVPNGHMSGGVRKGTRAVSTTPRNKIHHLTVSGPNKGSNSTVAKISKGSATNDRAK